LAENINERLLKGVKEINERHGKGANVRNLPFSAPNGPTYQVARHNAQHENDTSTQMAQTNDNASDSGGSDDEFYDTLLNEVENDPELLRIRRQRLEELRANQMKRAENLSKGHGQYRLIHQDEFLPECTGSEWVVAHFFHPEFQRCKIMDHHLQIIAEKNIECKFVRINADKAPFFIHKLKVKTLPTLMVFQNGIVVDRLIGFEGLSGDSADPDSWHTGRLQAWLSRTGAIKYTPTQEDLANKMRRLGVNQNGSLRSNNNLFYDDND
jgi:thiol-disulfide isomerase/thioredoxin